MKLRPFLQFSRALVLPAVLGWTVLAMVLADLASPAVQVGLHLLFGGVCAALFVLDLRVGPEVESPEAEAPGTSAGRRRVGD